ncbi:MAG: hypothetical protein GY851_16430 [bacterium]|nr:hypothetical protein [bacterium]
MSKSKLTIYLVIPVAVSLVLLSMYFSGDIVLQRLVSPKLPPLPPDSWREFGILENLEHLILLGMFVVSCIGVVRKQNRIERYGFALLAAFTMFVFLEEIDYGTHVLAFLRCPVSFQWFLPVAEWPRELISQIDLVAEPVNIHNQAGLTKIMKNLADLSVFGLFLVTPFVAGRVRNTWVRYLAPEKYAVLTVIAIVILRCLTHALGDREEAAVKAAQIAGNTARELGSISSNLSEFRELNVYYLFLVYLAGIVFLRTRGKDAQATGNANEHPHVTPGNDAQ